uniref:Calponin-homology (CH) domain-containing protein n=1 Tax=Romanomermis culicivorax TaxID=13658 RepID=A0A915HYJ5_ROMCU
MLFFSHPYTSSQLFDVIKPGMVDWKKVAKSFHKLRGMMDQIQNCNYAIDLGKQLHFSLVGIQGKDIYDGSRMLILALVWQLMRAYTLSILANCTATGQDNGSRLATEQEILSWANKKLKQGSKSSSVSGFQDPKLSDAKIIVDLIDAIHPQAIDYNLVSSETAVESKLKNAKYAISTARKIGAKVYALPEDIVEVKPKMIMTVFACLMCLDYTPNVKENGKNGHE